MKYFTQAIQRLKERCSFCPVLDTLRHFPTFRLHPTVFYRFLTPSNILKERRRTYRQGHACSDDLVQSVVRRTAARQHGVPGAKDAEQGARDRMRAAEALDANLLSVASSRGGGGVRVSVRAMLCCLDHFRATKGKHFTTSTMTIDHHVKTCYDACSAASTIASTATDNRLHTPYTC